MKRLPAAALVAQSASAVKAGARTRRRVLPPQQMAKLMRDLDAMPNSDQNKVLLKRFIGSESVQVTLDKAGRICLPEQMARDAGIGDEAVLAGLLDRFEIWSPERYDKVKASNAIMAPEAFKLME